jgi:Zn-dependent protease with chaperone function
VSEPTGLYGWIRSNDGRSTTLFVGFLLAIQPIAALALFLPLALVDPEHAPFLDWTGYATRYMLLVALASVIWFACQMFWHIETVKRAIGFEFIDDSEEPRLCRLIEPLIMMLGLPIPYVGVIASPALNAFACGIGRKKAVVVVTRGLIDSLDDDELSAVLAHELSHIKNGDIRLMAAANIFMSALTRLHQNNPLKLTVVHALMAIAVPAILPLALAATFVGHLALRVGQVSRLLIASSREFIADAEAVQLTKNPAALAAALVKVEHDYHVEGARTEDDAMMIAGDTEGSNATHPTVVQRVTALARTTGSMVFNAPSASRGFGRVARSATLEQAEAAALLRRLPPTRAISRVQAQARENFTGLTRNGVLLAAATLFSLMCIHASELDNPRAIAAKFDVRPLGLVLGMPFACQYFPKGETCTKSLDSRSYRDFEGQKNTLAGWLASVNKDQNNQDGAAGSPVK